MNRVVAFARYPVGIAGCRGSQCERRFNAVERKAVVAVAADERLVAGDEDSLAVEHVVAGPEIDVQVFSCRNDVDIA